MKTRRNIIIISFVISLLSLLFVFLLKQSTKIYEVVLAFMGSSFISFMLELPNYKSLKKDNMDRLYYSLFRIKLHTSILINTTNNSLYKYNIVIDKYYENTLKEIDNAIVLLKSFDSNYYCSRRKNELSSKCIMSIDNSYNNVRQSLYKYTADYNDKRIEVINIEGTNRNVRPQELEKSLNLIIVTCQNLIDTLDKTSGILLSKENIDNWKNDDVIIKNEMINSIIS